MDKALFKKHLVADKKSNTSVLDIVAIIAIMVSTFGYLDKWQQTQKTTQSKTTIHC